MIKVEEIGLNQIKGNLRKNLDLVSNKSISGVGTSSRKTKECLSIKDYLAVKTLSNTSAQMNSVVTLSLGTLTKEVYLLLPKYQEKISMVTQLSILLNQFHSSLELISKRKLGRL